MSKHIYSVLILTVILLPAYQAAGRPGISKSRIPKDTPNEVRAQIMSLYSKSVSRRANSAKALGKMGDKASDAIPFLAAMLHDKNMYKASRTTPLTTPGRQAATALGKIGPAALKALVSHLNSSNLTTRANAAYGLGVLKDRRAVPALLATLKDKEWEPRCHSAIALGRIKETSALQPLAELLVRDNTSWVRMAAATALGDIGDKRATAALLAGLRDSTADVRKSTAKALGVMKDNRAVPALIRTLKDKHMWVRRCAALALGEIPDERSVEPLIKRLYDVSDTVSSAAAESLSKLGKPAVPALIKRINDKNERVQRQVTRALDKITGNKFGGYPERWQYWWEKQGKEFMQEKKPATTQEKEPKTGKEKKPATKEAQEAKPEDGIQTETGE